LASSNMPIFCCLLVGVRPATTIFDVASGVEPLLVPAILWFHTSGQMAGGCQADHGVEQVENSILDSALGRGPPGQCLQRWVVANVAFTGVAGECSALRAMTPSRSHLPCSGSPSAGSTFSTRLRRSTPRGRSPTRL
jgi:hypothetical protein